MFDVWSLETSVAVESDHSFDLIPSNFSKSKLAAMILSQARVKVMCGLKGFVRNCGSCR